MTYEFTPAQSPRMKGFAIWRVEPSLSGEAGPTYTLMGYASTEAEVRKFYPDARRAK